MTPDIASKLLPLVRDHINNRSDVYYYGCFVGACDMLEKLGHITEAEYCFVTQMADTKPDTLFATLKEDSREPQQETSHAG